MAVHQHPNAILLLLLLLLLLCHCPGGEGVLLGIFGRGVPPGSPNPDPISDQNMPFSTPVFRPLFYRSYCFASVTKSTIGNIQLE